MFEKVKEFFDTMERDAMAAEFAQAGEHAYAMEILAEEKKKPAVAKSERVKVVSMEELAFHS